MSGTLAPPRPAASVIMVAHDGEGALDDAVRSLRQQTHEQWELIIVDDASTDATRRVARRWARADERVSLIELDQFRGRNHGRNVGLAAARGNVIAYLECGAEFYPEHLASILPLFGDCDAVACPFDVDGGHDDETCERSWDPGAWIRSPFLEPLDSLLGIAHRRDALSVVGGFNELICAEDEAEFVRRLIRSGTTFAILGIKCGLRRKPAKAAEGRRPPPTVTCRIRENRIAGRPLYTVADRPRGRPNKSIAFVAPNCVIDSGSGAAVAVLRQLSLLQRLGFSCQAFCGSLLDVRQEELIEEALSARGIEYEVRRARIGVSSERMLFAVHEGVPITIFGSSSTVSGFTGREQSHLFAEAFGRFLTAIRPDVLLTFGGSAISQATSRMARAFDIPIVFGLHNFAYGQVAPFTAVDYVAVPSRYSSEFYWRTLGLNCVTLPNVVVDDSMLVTARQDRHVVCVNPQLAKGITVFIAIATALLRRRPDIPMLLVESRGRVGMLGHIRERIECLQNVKIIPNTPYPRSFYEMASLVLMPSLWNESFGLTAAEAMYNGIPVLATDRGALPEIVGSGGFLFDVPARYTPQTSDVPAPEEVEPWIETIIRLWDDPLEYAIASDRAKTHAQRWHPDRLGPLYRGFFSDLAPQPCPPLAPPGVR